MVDPSDPYAETQVEREKLRGKFARIYHASHPKGVETPSYDWDLMVAFYKFPKAHWSHLRTSNTIVSSFATLRLRTDAATRFKKVSNATAVIWKMLMVAQGRSRRLSAPELLNDVYHGARHIIGVRTRELPERAAA